MSQYFLYLVQLFLADRSIQHDWYVDWLFLVVVLCVVISLALVSIALVASSCATIIVEVVFVFILLVIRVIVLTFVIWILNMCFIYFYFFQSLCNIYIVDVMDSSFIDTLFGDDARFKIHGLLKCSV